MNKEFGTHGRGLLPGRPTLPTHTWRKWVKPRKLSVRIVNIRANFELVIYQI